MNIKLIFHYISYLQYPLLVFAVYFAISSLTLQAGSDSANLDLLFRYLNNSLVFIGLAISFSTLQDTTKTQNQMSKRIWESPTKGNVFLLIITITAIFLIVFGLFQYFLETDSRLKELSFGLLVLGIGAVGMLKTAIEMFENHRKDKN